MKCLLYLFSGLMKNFWGFFPVCFISHLSSCGTLNLFDTNMSKFEFILNPVKGSSKYSMVIYSGACCPLQFILACRTWSISLNSIFSGFVVPSLKKGTALLLILLRLFIWTFMLSEAWTIIFSHLAFSLRRFGWGLKGESTSALSLSWTWLSSLKQFWIWVLVCKLERKSWELSAELK